MAFRSNSEIFITPLITIYFHDSATDCSKAPIDCQSEFKNAKNNNNVQSFYQRCKEVHDSNAFGKRCELCCKGQSTGTI